MMDFTRKELTMLDKTKELVMLIAPNYSSGYQICRYIEKEKDTTNKGARLIIAEAFRKLQDGIHWNRWGE